LTFSIKEG